LINFAVYQTRKRAGDGPAAARRGHLAAGLIFSDCLSRERECNDVKQIGRELGVRYVLEGSVRKAGGRVRITAQLIDAQNGAHVWAERYDREFNDIFALQDELTLSVCSAPSSRHRETDRFGRQNLKKT
jgi:hypothetical protein